VRNTRRIMSIIGIALVVAISLYFIFGYQPGDLKNLFNPPANDGRGSTATAITGKIDVGTKVEAVRATIGTSGGNITINKPGDALDGFQLEVPANSYNDTRTFQVSYAPVKSHTFGQNFNPISPLISVDNGGGYSDEVMLVKIPVRVPEAHFAMGFFYDSESGQLEGLPLVTEDNSSITVATRHFSNIIASSIEEYRLNGLAESGFRPGFDDWQFPNWGSYIEPAGHCAGQSLTVMWYYVEKFLKGKSQLHGLYDNDTQIWQDDTFAYRLASIVQKDINWDSLVLKRMRQESQKWTARQQVDAFAYSILATGQPQYVSVRNKSGGHAMVVYKVQDGNLFVADPNYPGALDRKIEFNAAEGKFKPYNSGANQDAIKRGEGQEYDQILYMAKSAMIDFSKIAIRWSEMENHTIGSREFPEYSLVAIKQDGTERELKDGFTTDEGTLTIQATKGLGTCIYQNGAWQPNDRKDPTVNTTNEVNLKEGPNRLGIWVCARIENTNRWTWFDFRWVTVNYTPSSAPTELSLDKVSIDNASMKASWVPSDLAASEGDGSYQWQASVALDFGGITLPQGAWLILEPGNFMELKDKFIFSDPYWGFPNIELQSTGPVNQVTFELGAISEWYFQKERPPLPVLTLKGLTLVVWPYGRPPIPGEQEYFRDFDIVITAR